MQARGMVGHGSLTGTRLGPVPVTTVGAPGLGVGTHRAARLGVPRPLLLEASIIWRKFNVLKSF